MAPLTKINLAFMHFAYIGGVHSHDFVKVHRRHDVSTLSYYLSARYEWTKTVLNAELIKLSKAPDIKFSEWRFEATNRNLFELDDIHYDKFIIFLGEDLVHFNFFNDFDFLEGQADLKLTYCSCCLQESYKKIVQEVKAWISDHGIKPKRLPQVSTLVRNVLHLAVERVM